MAALDEPTTSTKPTTLRRKAHGAFGAACARRRGGFRAHLEPSAFRAWVVDFVGIVDVVERPGQGWQRRFPYLEAREREEPGSCAQPLGQIRILLEKLGAPASKGRTDRAL